MTAFLQLSEGARLAPLLWVHLHAHVMNNSSTQPRSLAARLLGITAVCSAVTLTASYVWWTQHKADTKREARIEQNVETPAAPEDEPVEFIDMGGPITTADGLALSSKSISNPIFSTRRIAEAVEETVPEEPQFQSSELISGSKSWANVAKDVPFSPQMLSPSSKSAIMVPIELAPKPTLPSEADLMVGSKSPNRGLDIPLPPIKFPVIDPRISDSTTPSEED